MVNNILYYIATFIFVFSILSLLRLSIKFVSSLISFTKMEMSLGELTYYGLTLSYLITYIVFGL
jgi:hypothetical protein